MAFIYFGSIDVAPHLGPDDEPTSRFEMPLCYLCYLSRKFEHYIMNHRSIQSEI